eukprot:gene6469-3102_t
MPKEPGVDVSQYSVRSARTQAIADATRGSIPFSEKYLKPFRDWFVDGCTPSQWEQIEHHFWKRSLLFLGTENPVRRFCCRLVTMKVFEWFMLVAILANCVTLAMGSNKPGFNDTSMGQSLILSNYVFVGVFTFEAATKIIAYGFLLAPKTYLRNGWNLLDFVVLVTAYLEFTSFGASSTAIRSARVLRPLRTITKIEELRVIVLAVIKSIPMMADVFVLTLFYLSIFGIACVQIFMGKLKNRCGVADLSGAYTGIDGSLEIVTCMVSADDADDVCAGPDPNANTWTNTSSVSIVTCMVSADDADDVCAGPDPNANTWTNTSSVSIVMCMVSADDADDVCAGPDPNAGTWTHSSVPNVTYMVSADDADDVCAGPDPNANTWTNTSGVPLASVSNTPQGHVCRWEPDGGSGEFAEFGSFCTPFGNPERYRDFDNILYAWLAIFQHIFTEDCWWTWPLHLTMMILGAFLILNLALAVLFLYFTKGLDFEKKKREEDKSGQSDCGSGSGSDRPSSSNYEGKEESKEKGQIKLLADYDSDDEEDPKVVHNGKRLDQDSEDGNHPRVSSGQGGLEAWEKTRDWCYYLAMNKTVNWTTTAVIVLNAITLALLWYNQPDAVTQITTYANYVFTIYFLLETSIKMIGLGINAYFADNMNTFDFIVTSAGVIDMAISLGGVQSDNSSALSVIYISLLLFLFLFICGLLGMQLFGYKLVFCDLVEGSQQLCPPGLEVSECPSHFDCYVPCEADQVSSWVEVPGSPYGGLAFCEQFPPPAGGYPNVIFPAPTLAEGLPDSPPSPPSSPLPPVTYSSTTGVESVVQYWAQVGKVTILPYNYDDIFQRWFEARQHAAIGLRGQSEMPARLEGQVLNASDGLRAQFYMPAMAVFAVFCLLTLEPYAATMHQTMEATNTFAAIYFVIVITIGINIILNLFLAILLANLGELSGTRGPEEDTLSKTPSARGSSQVGYVQDLDPNMSKGKPIGEGAEPGLLDSGDPSSDDGIQLIRDANEPPLSDSVATSSVAGGRPIEDASKPQPSYSVEHSSGAGVRPIGRASEPQPSHSVEDTSGAGVRPSGEATDPQPSTSVASSSVAGAGPLGEANEPLPFVSISSRSSTEAKTRLQAKTLMQARSSSDLHSTILHAMDEDEREQGTISGLSRALTSIGKNTNSRSSSAPNNVLVSPRSLSPGLNRISTLATASSSSPLGHSRVLNSRPAQQPTRDRAEAFRKPAPTSLLAESSDSILPEVTRGAARNRMPSPVPFEAEEEECPRHSTRTSNPIGATRKKRRSSALWDDDLSVGVQRSGPSVAKLDASSIIQKEEEPDLLEFKKEDADHGYALGIFGPDNKFRQLLAYIIGTQVFEISMLILILASCVMLALDSYQVDQDSTLKAFLVISDYVFTGTFALEAILKVIVLGFAFNGSGSYIRSCWNQLDLFVVIMGLLVIIMQIFFPSSNAALSLRSFRALRGLRPIRATRNLKGVRVVAMAIAKAVPAVMDVVLVGSLFYFIFAVLAVNLLIGQMFVCIDQDGMVLDPYYLVKEGNINVTWCEQYSGYQDISTSYYHAQLGVPVPTWQVASKWKALLFRFDNVIMSLWVLYQLASLEGWSETSLAAMDTTGVGEQPLRNANLYIGIFFIAFIIFCSFFILNLIIGVSIDKFNQLKKQKGGVSILMTAQQTQWLTIQRLMATTTPARKYKKPTNPIRKFCFAIVFTRWFDIFMITAILLNVLTMFMVHEGMSDKWQDSLMAANVAFTSIFVVEMMIKMLAINIKPYFQDGWNQFDFLVVVISVVGCIMDYVATSDLAVMSLLRVLRVLRIFKLVPKAKGLRMMLQTLYWSLPALGNVAAVMLLFVYIYSIIGMNLFGAIKIQDSITRHVNFQTFFRSFLTLMSIITGENWPSIQADCMTQDDCWEITTTTFVGAPFNTTLEEGTYLDPYNDEDLIKEIPGDHKENRCSPAPILAIFYFCSFMLVVVYLLLQLVIGIILENIELHASMESMDITHTHILAFVEKWEELDVDGSGFIDATCLTSLLLAVPTPMGVKGKDRIIMRVQNILMEADIPYRSNQLHFLETLHALTGRVAGAELPADEEYVVHNRLIQRLPKDESPPKYSVADFYCAMQVKTSIKGFLIRKKLSDITEKNARGLNKFSSITRLQLDEMIGGINSPGSQAAPRPSQLVSPRPGAHIRAGADAEARLSPACQPPSPPIAELPPRLPAKSRNAVAPQPGRPVAEAVQQQGMRTSLAPEPGRPAAEAAQKPGTHGPGEAGTDSVGIASPPRKARRNQIMPLCVGPAQDMLHHSSSSSLESSPRLIQAQSLQRKLAPPLRGEPKIGTPTSPASPS